MDEIYILGGCVNDIFTDRMLKYNFVHDSIHYTTSIIPNLQDNEYFRYWEESGFKAMTKIGLTFNETDDDFTFGDNSGKGYWNDNNYEDWDHEFENESDSYQTKNSITVPIRLVLSKINHSSEHTSASSSESNATLLDYLGSISSKSTVKNLIVGFLLSFSTMCFLQKLGSTYTRHLHHFMLFSGRRNHAPWVKNYQHPLPRIQLLQLWVLRLQEN
jgi:hypothetical protein